MPCAFRLDVLGGGGAGQGTARVRKLALVAMWRVGGSETPVEETG